MKFRLKTNVDFAAEEYKKKFQENYDDEIYKLKAELEKIIAFEASISGNKDYSSSCKEIEENDFADNVDIEECEAVKKRLKDAREYLISFCTSEIHNTVKSPTYV